jgi:hypothetical protein
MQNSGFIGQIMENMWGIGLGRERRGRAKREEQMVFGVPIW